VNPHPPLAIFSLFAGNGSAGASPYIGVSYDQQGQRLALGLNERLEATWSYNLPGGAHDSSLEWAQEISWLNGGAGGWCFASPDGAIHFVGDDGQFHDYFFPGEPIRGLGTANGAEGSLLLLSTDGGVQAWIQDRASAAP
jgi:hypothetical protein